MSSPSPKATYKRLGSSGLRVSVPILGTMGMGDPKWIGWQLGTNEALPILKKAWDSGINTWDTANMYSNGLSESIVAQAISKYEIPRENLIIITKVHHIVHKDTGTAAFAIPGIGDTRDYVNQHGLSRAAIFNAVEASLKRLNSSYIDILLIHRFDYNTSPEETMQALHDLVTTGKVRYIGASSMWAWQFQMLNNIAERKNLTKFVCMQNAYSLLYREEEKEMNAFCNFAGIGIIPYSPLSGGYLARPLDSAITHRQSVRKGTPLDRKLSENERKIIARVESLAKEKHVDMSHIALAWVQAKCASPIVGINSVEQVEKSIVEAGLLTGEEMKFLEELYEPQPVKGHI